MHVAESRQIRAVLFDIGRTLVRYYEREEFPAILEEAVASVGRYLQQQSIPLPAAETVARATAEENHEAADHSVRPTETRLTSDEELFGNALLGLVRSPRTSSPPHENVGDESRLGAVEEGHVCRCPRTAKRARASWQTGKRVPIPVPRGGHRKARIPPNSGAGAGNNRESCRQIDLPTTAVVPSR